MNHSDFTIGGIFWCSDRQWRCTDIGSRVIIAMRIDSVEVGSTDPALRRTLSRSEAEAEGWFKGPPYAVSEVVFDEYDMDCCTPTPEGEGSEERLNLQSAPQSGNRPETNLAEALRRRFAPFGGIDRMMPHPPQGDTTP